MFIDKNLYVRTNRGNIFKIENVKIIDEDGTDYVSLKRKDSIVRTNPGFLYSKDSEVVQETHPDLLELLKPGDLLYIDIDPHDGHGGIVVPRVAETMNELEKYVELIRKGEWQLDGIVAYEKLQRNCDWFIKVYK